MSTKCFTPNEQTIWNTSHLHGIAWSCGKLDYEKLFAVFYNIKVMNAEVSAGGLENYRLRNSLLGQNVENLDDYDCPNIQSLVKMDSLWLCSMYPFRHKTRLQGAESKSKVYGEGDTQHFYILYMFIVFVFTTNSILSTRRDFFL